MLRRAENVYVSHRLITPGDFRKRRERREERRRPERHGPVVLTVGREHTIVIPDIPETQFQTLLAQAADYPVWFGRMGERQYWLFAGRWHWDNDGLTPEQVYALLVTKEQRNQARISRAQTMVAMQQVPAPAVRGAIPDDVKQLVWTRDGGRCRQCGANVELQYDHIIPVAYGGANTPENLQILCGPCNRRKGASVH
jgi:HNH endonuclease